MTEIKNKFAIVTGASRGIGKAIATALAHEGVNLLVTSRTEEALVSLRNELSSFCNIKYFRADLSDSQQIRALFNYSMENHIKPDILVHSAGVFFHNQVIDILEEELDLAYKVNFKAPCMITKQFLSEIIENKGSIVFINSTAAINPKKFSTVYSTTKTALKVFAKILHKEVHSKGVRILNISAGRVDTAMQQIATKLEGIEYNALNYLSPQNIADLVIQNLKLSPGVDIHEIIIRPSLNNNT